MTENNFSSPPYLPHTDADRLAMLSAIAKSSFEDLIGHIPAAIRIKELNIAPGLSEPELYAKVAALAEKNKPASQQTSFLGGGSYRRYVPAVVPAIISRSEFSTAYTPYQPEVSQGTLQAIYEFQTAICLLTGMEVANASMYDGPTACAEAALMASRLTGRRKIFASSALNPEYDAVTRTYVENCGLTYEKLALADGITDIQAANFDQTVAAVIIQYPNYFGCLENLAQIEAASHKNGSLFIVVSEPISLGLLTPPGEFKADIVVGDAQPCGNFLSFGGPSAGYMACRKDFVRQLPGRLSGMTVDNRGQRAFTLTLQTREQHIRRAGATSNICTNQALNALAMLTYIAALGPQGLKELSELSMQRAHYLADKLSELPGVKLVFNQPFLNEFAITTPYPASELLTELKAAGILGGINLAPVLPKQPGALLIAVTEMNTPDELERYIKTMGKIQQKKMPNDNCALMKQPVQAVATV